MNLARVHTAANVDAVSAWVACGRVIDRCVKRGMAEGLTLTVAGTFVFVMMSHHDPLGPAPVIASVAVAVLAVTAMLIEGRLIDREQLRIADLVPAARAQLNASWSLPPGTWHSHPSIPISAFVDRTSAFGEAATDVVVWFRLDQVEVGPRVRWEGLAAQLEDAGLARIVSIPFFAHGVNFGDRVRTTPGPGGQRVAEEVVQDGGQSRVRVHYPTRFRARQFSRLLAGMPTGVWFERVNSCVFELSFPQTLALLVQTRLEQNRLIISDHRLGPAMTNTELAQPGKQDTGVSNR